MAKANIVKKLSMRQLVGEVGKFIPTKEIEEKRDGKTVIKEVPAIGETVWLADVIGIARGTKSGTSNYGDWSSLIGEFIARPLIGDKVGNNYRTGQLFLPDVVLTMISSMIGNNTGVEFAFKIGITAVPTDGARPSNTGYEYTADFLMEPAENDPLETLAAKALPAPEPTT